jgi:type III secretion system YscQ/HrcQ family protein
MTRDEAVTLRSHARGEPFASLVRGAIAARTWLGVAPRWIEVAAASTEKLAEGADPIVAILLEDAQGARAGLELDVSIASVLFDRTLGGEGVGLEGTSARLRDIERGVLAHAFARWLADARSSFGVAAVLTSSAALRLALGEGARLRRSLVLRLGDAEGRAVLWSADALGARPRRMPSWAGGLPIELIVRGAWATLSAREIASLERGDIVVPDGCELRFEEQALTGIARLGARGTTCAWRARIERAELTIVERELEGAPGRRGATEVGVKDGDRVLDEVGDTPVALALELARFVLPLAEIAALAPGEVVRTGAPIGERVSLRAGDRVVAVGELIDVEGEVGMRIVELPE